MTVEEENAYLRGENEQLREQLRQALQRIEELEKHKTPPPSFVKANVVKPKEKQARKKRRPQQNGVRRRQEPTQIIEHRLDDCPECQGRLSGISLARRREVIEIPPPQPVAVTEHQVYKGWCSYCRKWQEAPLHLEAEVVGQGRLGVGVCSLIAYLRLVLRTPIRQIQTYLAQVHQLALSAGEIVEVLHRLEQHTRGAVVRLKAQVRASPLVHADETGWREDGRNGYVWSVSTPQGLRYFEYHHSRAGQVIQDLLGEDFKGVLVCDFYGGYNDLACPHQRCWVHLLRDGHDLKDTHPQQTEVQAWCDALSALYRSAVLLTGTGEAAYAELLAQAKALAGQYASSKAHPCRALAKRLLRHQDELFQFVLRSYVPADNNLAERSIRPLVVTRKVSGGSRSAKGSTTRMGLASLFATWQAQGLNVLAQGRHILAHPSPLPQL
jgi:transposase